jgi:phosphatidylserine decarboxylase
LTYVLADMVIAHHQVRLGATAVRRITIDLDPTEEPTHGQIEGYFPREGGKRPAQCSTTVTVHMKSSSKRKL